MRCPFCGNEDTQVKDSRPTEDSSAIRRRRSCNGCGGRFTSFERVQLRDMTVVKAGQRRQPFEREKLIRSLKVALQKRPVDQDQIERIANSIQRQLESSGDNEITSEKIGDYVMQALRDIDSVAYIRYASVYKNFEQAQDFNQFIEELKRLKVGSNEIEVKLSANLK